MYARCRILTITSLYGLSCSRPCTKFIHRSVSRTSAFLHTAPKKKKARLTFKPVPRAKPIKLSDEQQHVHDMVLAGNSVFFTGSAGTGKSVLLRRIIQSLREKDGTGGAVAVTASTGIAAINIGGTTLHAFAGVGLGKGSTHTMIERARKNRATSKRLKSAKVLVIDEISMVEGRWFDKLNDLLKAVRRTPRRPFGGLQLVICGDFFQLPPVPDEPRDGEDTSVKFAFQAECWDQAVPNIIRLTKVFRQRQPQLIALLNDLREGVVSPRTEQLLTGLSREARYKHGIRPTELFPHRRSADAANQRHMDRLDGEKMMFVAEDDFNISEEQGELLLDKMIAKEIELGVGAQVMCTRNITDTIVNGSVGVITEFAPLDKGGEDLWPNVQFDNGETRIMEPEEYEHQDEHGERLACREQVPLILAWALTIHKAQGQTLGRVKVDLAHAFANGQAYVALSRCSTLEGLQVLNFHRGVVFVDPAVVEWSKKLAVIADK